MSEMKHTPTPWYFAQSGDDFYIIGKPEWPCRRNGVEQEWEICRMDDMVGERQDEVKANAAYIVECVNSHASLVEENKRMREALQMTRATVGDLRKGFAPYVTPERWVEQLQSFIDEVLGDANA